MDMSTPLLSEGVPETDADSQSLNGRCEGRVGKAYCLALDYLSSPKNHSVAR